tara:strand:- start:204 stop:446 length:243 start_codon:yes stop_codon:yes gene_type:complete
VISTSLAQESAARSGRERESSVRKVLAMIGQVYASAVLTERLRLVAGQERYVSGLTVLNYRGRGINFTTATPICIRYIEK